MFRRWIYKLVRRAWEDHDRFSQDDSDSSRPRNRFRASNMLETISSGDSAELHSDRMRFNLYKSVGGHILETTVYNRREDENEHTLYMIKEEEDFAQQVAHAIMLEMMKQ
jgi:hypothetical protein